MKGKNLLSSDSKELDYTKLVIIAPSLIDKYQVLISEAIEEKVSYMYRYIAATDLIRAGNLINFKICVPDHFFDSSNKANDFAKQVKKINSKNTVYCYSRITPEKTNNLDGFVSGYEEEKEVDIIIGLLR